MFPKGKTHSPETRKLISDRTRLALSEPIVREKHHLGVILAWDDQERRRSLSERMMGNLYSKGRKLPPEHRAALAATLPGNQRRFGKLHTPESRMKMSMAHAGVKKSPQHADNLRKHLANIKRPTSIENILREKLESEYPEEEIIPEFLMGKFIYDFAIPRLKILFEADGEYWHSSAWAKNRDQIKDKHAQENGWEVFRFPGKFLLEWKRASP